MMVPDDKQKKRRKKIKKVDPYACKHGKKYSKSDVPYDQICKQRYHQSVVQYNQQFLKELETLERMQTTAYEQTRFHRLFAITTLWPPLHTRKEIDYTINTLYKSRIEKRVDEILQRNF